MSVIAEVAGIIISLSSDNVSSISHREWRGEKILESIRVLKVDSYTKESSFENNNAGNLDFSHASE